MGIKQQSMLFTPFQNFKEEEISQSREEAELCLDPASRDQNSCLPQTKSP